jgi:hypothetical protein
MTMILQASSKAASLSARALSSSAARLSSQISFAGATPFKDSSSSIEGICMTFAFRLAGLAGVWNSPSKGGPLTPVKSGRLTGSVIERDPVELCLAIASRLVPRERRLLYVADFLQRPNKLLPLLAFA